MHPKLARILANLINSYEWKKLLNKETSLKSLRLNKRIKAKIQEAITLNEKAKSLVSRPKNINLNLSKLKGEYTYKKYIVDKSCRLDCAFKPYEEKEINGIVTYQETLALEPYSVVLIILDKKPAISEEVDKDEEETVPIESKEEKTEEGSKISQKKGVEQ